jgi:hypothetical protein
MNCEDLTAFSKANGQIKLRRGADPRSVCVFVGWKDALNRLFTCDLEATRLTRLTRLTSLACLSFMLALCRAGETKFEDYSRREVQREKEERAEKTKERERNAKSNGTPVNTYSTTTDHRTGQQDNSQLDRRRYTYYVQYIHLSSQNVEKTSDENTAKNR